MKSDRPLIRHVVMRTAAGLLGVAGLAATNAQAADTEGKAALALNLPAACYAVPDRPLHLYYDNLVLSRNSTDLVFTVECDLGRVESNCWTVIPADKDVGDHPLRVKVATRQGQTLAQSDTMLKVAPRKAGEGKKRRILIVGDSLTGGYTAALAKLLQEPGNAEWTMLGCNETANRGRHLGWGGKDWAWFASKYNTEPRYTKAGPSPFVFLDGTGRPALNVSRYIQEQATGIPPDVVIFELGINDAVGLSPADPQLLEARLEDIVRTANVLVQAFRAAAPRTALAICGTPPPNARPEAFENNYPNGAIPQWRWRQVQHRLAQVYRAHFEGREREKIYYIPTELNIDTVQGYPTNNAVHPNAAGYAQIADSMYAWLKAWLAQGDDGQPAILPPAGIVAPKPRGTNDPVRVGVFVHPRYQKDVSAQLPKSQPGIARELERPSADLAIHILEEITPATLSDCDVAVVPNIRWALPPAGWEQALNTFVRNGGGALLVHHAVGFPLASDIVFPEVGRGLTYVPRQNMKVTVDHAAVTGRGLARALPGLAPGQEFTNSFPDFIAIESGPAGTVLVRCIETGGTNAWNVVVAGPVGKGKVVLCGLDPGQTVGKADGKSVFTAGVAEGSERQILWNSIRWLAP